MKVIAIGNSMKPTKPLISILTIKKQDRYYVGDIVSFRGKNRLFARFCHRVVNIDDKVFTTKGDNRVVIEKYEKNVPIRNIIGKVIKWLKVKLK